MLSFRIYFVLSLLAFWQVAYVDAAAWYDWSDYTKCGPCGSSGTGTRSRTRCCDTQGAGQCTATAGSTKTLVNGYECETVVDTTCAKEACMVGMTCGGQGPDQIAITSCELYLWGQTCYKKMPDLPCAATNPIMVYDDTAAAPNLYACLPCDSLTTYTCYKYNPGPATPASWVPYLTTKTLHNFQNAVIIGKKIYLPPGGKGEIIDTTGAGSVTNWPNTPGGIPATNRPGAFACTVALKVNGVSYIYMCGGMTNPQGCHRFNTGTGAWDTSITITLPFSCAECACAVNPVNRNQIYIDNKDNKGGSPSAYIYDAGFNVITGNISSPYNLEQSDIVEIGRDGALYDYNPAYALPDPGPRPFPGALKYDPANPALLWQTSNPATTPYFTGLRSQSSTVGVSLAFLFPTPANIPAGCTGV